MQPLRIVIDVRHIKDFGIGTYIRNLVKALGELDTARSVPAVGEPNDVPDLPQSAQQFRNGGLPSSGYRWDKVAFRGF